MSILGGIGHLSFVVFLVFFPSLLFELASLGVSIMFGTAIPAQNYSHLLTDRGTDNDKPVIGLFEHPSSLDPIATCCVS